MTDRGLFLDLDGTLADSLAVMRQVYDHFLAEQGRSGSDAEFDRLSGPPLTEIVPKLQRAHGLTGSEADLLSRYNALIDEAYRSVPPKGGAEHLLRAARERGRVSAVVTSNSRARTEDWLRDTGLDRLIDAVIGSEDSGRGKPYPDPYLSALHRCACVAERSLAVEDSPAGATAATAAGLATFALAPDADARDGWPKVTGFVDRLDAVVAQL